MLFLIERVTPHLLSNRSSYAALLERTRLLSNSQRRLFKYSEIGGFDLAGEKKGISALVV